MRLTAFICLAACLQVSARTHAQRVTITVRNGSLEKVFDEVRKQTGYEFLYNVFLLQKSHPVTVAVKDASVEEVLRVAFSDQPFTFTILDGKTIVVREKIMRVEVTESEGDLAPPIDIHGRVIDSLGNPLVGASVVVKGSRKGVSTDVAGRFELKGVAANATLVISFTGYQDREYKAGGSQEFSVVLSRLQTALDQIQVIAYGTTTKRMNIGNVSTVDAGTIEKQPINNPLLALEGQVTGVFIAQQAGVPGAGIHIQIQGQNSMERGNDPFYVVDGVPYAQLMLPNSGLILGQSGTWQNFSNGNPFSSLNPSDIESISVLKDADATAIYGTRAANGAILITTKKGKAGKTRLDVNLQNGFGKVGEKMHLLNTQQYLEMRHEGLLNDGFTTPGATDYDVNGLWDTTRYTDWQKVLLGGTAKYLNYNVSVSGGNANTQFLVGATYHRESSVFPFPSAADNKASIHFNISNSSFDQKFHMQFSGSYTYDNNSLPLNDLTSSALELAPDAPPVYNKDGSINWAPNAGGASTWSNPLVYPQYIPRTNNLTANTVLSYQMLKGLELRTSLGYTNLDLNEIATFPLSAFPPELRATGQARGTYAHNVSTSWIIEPQLEYKKVWQDHHLDLLAGATIDESNNNGLMLNGSGFISDALIADIRSAANVSIASSTITTYRYNAIFGRLSYNWAEKYLANLTVRRDGSSRFGSANEFHSFGALAGGWIFSKEQFFQDLLPVVSFGKINVSYGTTGNDQIGEYAYLDIYYPSGAGVPYQGIPVVSSFALANPYLQWEETRKLNVGMNLGLLKDRLLFEVNFFRNRSSNQLLNYALPMITGFAGIERNFPATLQNKGWEITLSSTNISTKDFKWTTRFNITLLRNKLISFPNLDSSSYGANLIIGQPVNILKTFTYGGVDPATGTYYVIDSHGKPTNKPDFLADVTSLYDRNPPFYGGFQNVFSYKGLQLDFLLQFAEQTGSSSRFGNAVPGAFNLNQPISVLARWRKPGDVTNVQRFTSTYGPLMNDLFNVQYSNGGNVNASYIRLKNVSLSYKLPDSWLKGKRIQNASVFIQGQNLLTFTKYDGLDPETLNNGGLPPLRVVTFGIQCSL